jgi:hypothetical protein
MSGFLENPENFPQDSQIALDAAVELFSNKLQSEKYSKELIAKELMSLGNLFRIQGRIQMLQEIKASNEKKKEEGSKN